MYLNIKSVNISLRVLDFQEAVAFYEKALDLQGKSQWPTYAVFLCGVVLGLEPRGDRGVKKGVLDIYLQVGDVDDAYRELKGGDSDSSRAESWVARTAEFADPDGSEFILTQLKR